MHVVVLGGGPGGYICSIRLAQLGAKVTLVEREHLGGTCLNVGCIPTKALLHAAELYRVATGEGAEYGIEAKGVALNWEKTQMQKSRVVSRLVEGVGGLMASNGIKFLSGTGRFRDEKTIAVELVSGTTKALTFDAAVIATGSRPKRPPVKGAELPGILTSTEALSLPEVPGSLCIVGGGVIGCELAQVYASFGTEVTVLEALPDLLPTMDADIVQVLKRKFRKMGIKVETGVRLENIEKNSAGFALRYGSARVEADKVLMATGRVANTEDIGLCGTRVKLDEGFIKVDRATMKTDAPALYAIGDCNGGVKLAHVASAEGVLAAEQIMGVKNHACFDAIPSGVYTSPELGCVGLTEPQAKEQGYRVKTGVFPLSANGKALISGDGGGLVKLVVDADTDAVLGLHIVGPRATDLVAEGTLAICMEATTEELISTIHAHPTVCEAVHEAAHAVHGGAFHLPKA